MANQNPYPDGDAADIDLSIDSVQPEGTVTFRVHNRGPHRASNVRIVLIISGNSSISGGPQSAITIRPGSTWAYSFPIGNEVGMYAGDDAGNSITHPAHSGHVTVKYEDGDGEQAVRWDFSIGEGSRFEDREFTICEP
jgi:hypothetical protein